GLLGAGHLGGAGRRGGPDARDPCVTEEEAGGVAPHTGCGGFFSQGGPTSDGGGASLRSLWAPPAAQEAPPVLEDNQSNGASQEETVSPSHPMDPRYLDRSSSGVSKVSKNSKASAKSALTLPSVHEQSQSPAKSSRPSTSPAPSDVDHDPAAQGHLKRAHSKRSTVRSESKRPTVLSWVNDTSRDQSRWANFKYFALLRKLPGTEQLISCLQRTSALKEPARTGLIHSFVRSVQFSFVCQSVILLNTFYVLVDTNYQIANLDKDALPISFPVDLFFGIFYTGELTLRIYTHRYFFFIGDEASWNWFDSFLVFVTMLDLLGSMGGNVGYTRVFRVLKVIKVLRVVRVLQFFTDLRMMINCVLASIVSLFWCIVMIVFVMFIFAVFFTQEATRYMKEDGPPTVVLADYPLIRLFFGNVQTTILTLFMSVTGGEDWKRVYDVLQPVGDVTCAFYLVFIFVFLFSILNIIMSIFVEKGVKMAAPDTNNQILETRRKQAADSKELMSLFNKADADGSQTISQQEFEMCIAKAEFKDFLATRGIDIKEARTFFNMVADTIGDRELDVGHVVRCCLGIKGFATSVDLHILRYEVREAMRMIEELHDVILTDSSSLGSPRSGSDKCDV
ncbi:unnamed protein product, partial [Prorocentrum cordatum]